VSRLLSVDLYGVALTILRVMMWILLSFESSGVAPTVDPTVLRVIWCGSYCPSSHVVWLLLSVESCGVTPTVLRVIWCGAYCPLSHDVPLNILRVMWCGSYYPSSHVIWLLLSVESCGVAPTLLRVM
jgi:hypothetical protein